MSDLIDRLEEIYNEKIRIECEWKEFNHYKVILKIEDKILKIIHCGYDHRVTLDTNVSDFVKIIDKLIIEYYKRGEE